MRIILASASPRRKELLELMGLSFEVIPSQTEETFDVTLNVYEQIKQIAYQKAKSVQNRIQEDSITISADTVVCKQGKVYGKPKDRQQAIQMIEDLKDSAHEVITALVVLMKRHGKEKEYLTEQVTKVHIKDMTKQEIIDWVDSEQAYDKAGAYAIQSKFCVHIDKIEGDYMSVVGLPVNQLYDILKEIEEDG